MLFLIALALVMIALAATGLSFERSLALAIAGLTTTGPAIVTLGDGLVYGELSAAGAGDLLRRDDRRAHGGAGDHRALQPGLLAAVAAARAQRATAADKMRRAHWKCPRAAPILIAKNNKGRRIGAPHTT